MIRWLERLEKTIEPGGGGGGVAEDLEIGAKLSIGR